jgi:hypothetical protein
MDRNVILARHVMEKIASTPVRDHFREGYLMGYMHKEAQINWAHILNQVKTGASKMLPANMEERVQTAGGALVGGLAGGALGGWKGALGGALAGGAGGLAAHRYDYKMPGVHELAGLATEGVNKVKGAYGDTKKKVEDTYTEGKKKVEKGIQDAKVYQKKNLPLNETEHMDPYGKMSDEDLILFGSSPHTNLPPAEQDRLSILVAEAKARQLAKKNQ